MLGLVALAALKQRLVHKAVIHIFLGLQLQMTHRQVILIAMLLLLLVVAVVVQEIVEFSKAAMVDAAAAVGKEILVQIILGQEIHHLLHLAKGIMAVMALMIQPQAAEVAAVELEEMVIQPHQLVREVLGV
jgi:hypothetical protein